MCIRDSSSFVNGVYIGGITTTAGAGGITTTGGDFYVGGDLYVGDDVEFDSISGRELSISGLGTIGELQATTATVSGVTTLSSAIITGIGTIQEFNVGTGGTVLYAATDGTIRLGTATTSATVTLNGGSIPSIGLVIALGG